MQKLTSLLVSSSYFAEPIERLWLSEAARGVERDSQVRARKVAAAGQMSEANL